MLFDSIKLLSKRWIKTSIYAGFISFTLQFSDLFKNSDFFKKMSIIKVEKLSYGYRSLEDVLSDVSFEMRSETILGLLGVNGAGKSTLIGILTGQLAVTSGKVALFGKEYQEHRNHILRDIALVPQSYAFYPTLTIEENLTFFAELRKDLGRISERVQDALGFCQLESYRGKRASELSGGLKRRLNLAIGIVNEPKLLFLDEPTVGIDPVARAFILEAIKRLNQQRKVSIVYTSHHMQEIEQLCDEVVVLEQGRILYQGDLSALKGQKGNYFSAQIKNLSEDSSHIINAFCKKHGLHLEGTFIQGRVHGVRASDILAEFESQVSKEGLEIVAVSMGPLSIEKVFFDLIDPQLVERLSAKG